VRVWCLVVVRNLLLKLLFSLSLLDYFTSFGAGSMTEDRTARKWYRHLKVTTGKAALTDSVAAVMRRFNLPRKFVRYHAEKFADPSFHSGSWGGARNCAFSDTDQTISEVQ